MNNIIRELNGKTPDLAPDVFVAPGAVVIGDVTIGAGSSVWYGSVLRGDVGHVRIGKRTNIQDLCMLHMSTGKSNCVVGDDVTVGHRVILHGCAIEDRALIGMGAIILDNAVIGAGSIVAAGAVVLENTIVPPGSLVVGIPAKVRDTKDGDRHPAQETAENYRRHAAEHGELYRK
ncbi:gamma carbonic anhydrase family protein [bacterium]|nr:gamma carbonic anhydrase family protein [bacterium]